MDIVSFENVKTWLDTFWIHIEVVLTKRLAVQGHVISTRYFKNAGRDSEIRHLSDVELYDVSDKENHNVAAWDMASDVLGRKKGSKRIVATIRDKIACL